MAEEPAEVRRPRGWSMIEIGREDLESYSVGELEERITALEAEIARTRAQTARKQAGKAAAAALFSRPA